MSARIKALALTVALGMLLAGCADAVRQDAELRARWAKQDAQNSGDRE